MAFFQFLNAVVEEVEEVVIVVGVVEAEGTADADAGEVEVSVVETGEEDSVVEAEEGENPFATPTASRTSLNIADNSAIMHESEHAPDEEGGRTTPTQVQQRGPYLSVPPKRPTLQASSSSSNSIAGGGEGGAGERRRSRGPGSQKRRSQQPPPPQPLGLPAPETPHRSMVRRGWIGSRRQPRVRVRARAQARVRVRRRRRRGEGRRRGGG